MANATGFGQNFRTLGASGVMMGARFLASMEARARYKQAILDAKAGDTIDSEVWDLLWGADWPGVKVRAFRDQRFDRWIGRRAELASAVESARAEFVAARENPDTTVPPPAGEGSARITALKPAAAIVRDVVAEAERGSVTRQRRSLEHQAEGWRAESLCVPMRP